MRPLRTMIRVMTLAFIACLLTGAQRHTVPWPVPLAEKHPVRVFLPQTSQGFMTLYRLVYARVAEQAATESAHLITTAQDIADQAHIRPFWFKEVRDMEDVRALSIQFGVPMSYLESLNPGVDFAALQETTRILIYRADPDLPARSVGTASGGHFVEGMPMIDDAGWVIRDWSRAWAMPHTVRRLTAGMRYVANRYPGASPMMIGDMSRFGGGRMRPHRSHQSGRDADVTYYSRNPVPLTQQFWDARTSDFDVARTWALFRYWLKRDWAEFIFADRAIQRMLADYAYSVGEDPEFVQRVFEVEGGGMRSIIRHSPGHANHFHVRFRCLDVDTDCK